MINSYLQKKKKKEKDAPWNKIMDIFLKCMNRSWGIYQKKIRLINEKNQSGDSFGGQNIEIQLRG